MFSADAILKMTEPGELFPQDATAAKKLYGELARAWHPDLHGHSAEANTVMTRINVLYEQYEQMMAAGTYKRPGLTQLRSKDGSLWEITYRIARPFELGTMYVGNTAVVYLIDSAHKDLFENAKLVTGAFKYKDDKMKQEFSRYLPKVLATFETRDGQFCMAIDKTDDLFLLRDILRYHGGKLPPRHVAWILSTLYNLACYLDYAGLAHNAITLDTYFISPKYHSGALLGGWWYSVPQQQKMLGVPAGIYDIMPPDIKSKKLSHIQTDLEAIRLIGRELLGDKSGSSLVLSQDIPKPLTGWLRGAAAERAFDEYSAWPKILQDSFGARKFVEMPIDADRLYREA